MIERGCVDADEYLAWFELWYRPLFDYSVVQDGFLICGRGSLFQDQ